MEIEVEEETNWKTKDLETVCEGRHEKDEHQRGESTPLSRVGETHCLSNPIRKYKEIAGKKKIDKGMHIILYLVQLEFLLCLLHHGLREAFI